MPAFGLPPIAGDRDRDRARRPRPDRACSGRSLRREGFRYRPILDFRDPELREILRLMGPGTLGLAAVQINVFVNTYSGDDAAAGRGLVAATTRSG